jgi:hypothetical protein
MNKTEDLVENLRIILTYCFVYGVALAIEVLMVRLLGIDPGPMP